MHKTEPDPPLTGSEKDSDESDIDTNIDTDADSDLPSPPPPPRTRTRAVTLLQTQDMEESTIDENDWPNLLNAIADASENISFLYLRRSVNIRRYWQDYAMSALESPEASLR